MNKKQLRSLSLGAFALFAAVLVSFLSFISVELAVAVFALCSVTLIVMVERTRRGHWEQSVDFRFKHFSKKHDALSEEVVKHRNTIAKIKETLGTSSMRKNSVPYRNIAARSEDAHAKPTDSSSRNELMRKVGAIKPANLPKSDIFEPQPRKISVIEDSRSLSDLVVEELMGHAVRNKSIDVFMQPIMRLPQRQRRFYEVFSRVRAKPGVYIPAVRYLKLAKRNGQIKDIDALMLAQCLDLVRQCSQTPDAPSFFINISTGTLKNGAFMNRLLAFLGKNRDLSGKLVFEMKQKEFHDLPIPLLQVLSGLARLGCSFSLDHVTNLDEDITDLQRFNVRFLKVSAEMFANAATNERLFKGIMKAKRLLEGNGVGVIVEKIEDEAIMRSLLDYDFHYGQGYLFGRPDLRVAYDADLKLRRA